MSGSAASPPGLGPLTASRHWIFAIGATLIPIGLLPLCWDPRYYFHGDTQSAYTGWWYELGDSVLHGRLPLLEPLRWEAGNYIAEGQWGLFSPLTMAIGVTARLAPNLVLFVTVLKLALLLLGGIGTFLVIRSYGGSPAAGYVGGIVVGLSGVSVYLDWPSWANGQMAVALLPWTWYFVRRTAVDGKSPLPALLACYLTVTVGYVYAALYLAIVLVGGLVEATLARDRRRFLRTFYIGIFAGLVVVTVYLPGVLTAPVTIRSRWEIVGAGRLTYSVSDLLSAMLPTTGGRYLLWCLPMLLWVDPARVRSAAKGLGGVATSLVLLLAWVLGPSMIGPLRWPLRVVPALMLPLVVLLVLLLSRAVRVPVSHGRLLASLAWVGVGAYLVVVRDSAALQATLVSTVLVALGLWATAWALRRGRGVAATVIGVATLAAFALQHVVAPAAPSADRHMPAWTADYRGQLPQAQGDGLLVGNPDAFSKSMIVDNPEIADELLVAASWYLNPHDVQMGYTTISYAAFRERFCRIFNGGTCSRALKALLAKEPTTGRRWVDLLSVSTLVFFKPDFKANVLRDPPSGWRVAGETDWTVTWLRDKPLPTAGGVVWTSPGLDVTQRSGSARTVEVTVDRAPTQGGTVVLSRLAWPGYEVSNATLGEPLQRLLVTVDVPAGSAGSTVTLHWNPPGWHLELACWWLAVLIGGAWSLLEALLVLRRRQALDGRSAGAGKDDPPVKPPPGEGREDETDHVGRHVVRQR